MTRRPRPPVFGWDIGGVNTKAARLDDGEGAPSVRGVSVPFEIQRDPGGLAPTLRSLAAELGRADGCMHGVTMTAELSTSATNRRAAASSLVRIASVSSGLRLRRSSTSMSSPS